MGTQELLIILVIVLVIFGGAKLPKLARSMGESIKEFRKSAGELTDDADGDEGKQA